MKHLIALLLVSLAVTAGRADGKGYVHDNIASSTAAIRKMGAQAGFTLDASDDPSVFTTENLKQYHALVFSNSNNQAFNNQSQRDTFQKYMESGGGFVGIHSASGSERDWPYFWSVAGGRFQRHPAFQKSIRVLPVRKKIHVPRKYI